MEAENLLPAPVRWAVHCLRSVMLTVKLASFIAYSTNSTEIICCVVFKVILEMRSDLARALQSFAFYTEAVAAAADLQQAPPSAAVAAAERGICRLSQLAIGLLLPILRLALKEIGNQTAADLPRGSLVAMFSSTFGLECEHGFACCLLWDDLSRDAPQSPTHPDSFDHSDSYHACSTCSESCVVM